MGRHSTSGDELDSHKILYVPPAWRKSLQAGLPKPEGKDPQRELFADLNEEDEQPSAETEADQPEDSSADEESADEPTSDDA